MFCASQEACSFSLAQQAVQCLLELVQGETSLWATLTFNEDRPIGVHHKVPILEPGVLLMLCLLQKNVRFQLDFVPCLLEVFCC